MAVAIVVVVSGFVVVVAIVVAVVFALVVAAAVDATNLNFLLNYFQSY